MTSPLTPVKTDQLFKFDNDWQNNACIDGGRRQWGLYSEGFRLAGDQLCKSVMETGRSQDLLVYPIVSNYRQYIELKLKEILRDGYYILDRQEGIPQHHRLFELWKECRSICEKIENERDARKDFNAVENLLHEFSTVDPTGEGFRYPVRKNGDNSLDNLKYVNLRNLMVVMNRVHSLLDGISAWTSVIRDYKSEYESEYSREQQSHL